MNKKFKIKLAKKLQYFQLSLSNTITDLADALHHSAGELSEEECQRYGVSRTKVKYIAQELFPAGFVSTLESFRWLINLMAAFPAIQAKVHTELDQRLQGQVSLADHNGLPITEATIVEMLRFVSIIPLLFPHWTMNETTLKG